MGKMRKSVQKTLGLLIEDHTTKVRIIKPYTRKVKHKQLYI
jgi:hypothetical protein